MKRQQHLRRKHLFRKNISIAILIIILIILIVTLIFGLYGDKKAGQHSTANKTTTETNSSQAMEQSSAQKITITASGDMLYHDIVYGSAFDGQSYDFTNDYEQITPLVSSADLALGDFEGTINPNRELAGYPIFNAPEAVISSIKNAGYDAIDLAHNHILDTGIEGLEYTANAFQKAGIDTFGVNVPNDDILIKEINGIKVAILGFSYGFNGIEATISQADYDHYLNDLNMAHVKSKIEAAEKKADLTIVMPQSGVEYSLEPTEEQQTKYRQMVDYGADIIFGGHPHVAESTEIIEKDGAKKFIIYSMGNLLSNQRYETLENYWTERGVIMEVEVTKENNQTTLTGIKAHPTWVSREPIDRTFLGYPAYDYQVFLAEDYLSGGKYVDTVSEEKRQRIETAYHEMIDLLNIQ
ncbi:MULTISPECIES: CapA family protein [unclassified Enterococcus]|uniref:CapA family protein n=1 Tax=unclassified Enterococcus TaxID=2608891 RepID=UPI0015579567|nr:MULTISPECIES: CapA family protein [unclassified Enterococcus]MBS7577147.1 CapA family protein [Enterococcus sp. MMGLQ5-2]MBS7584406.1 CapA family protein [Enterococcus sp. MMGLQ5-1]NPD12261.1 CapA family protein [Enterococcus sp. MMGLQ5-1]NPD36981.1 CapA family protein [Enterococcus sp. MMGLQ5-2]